MITDKQLSFSLFLLLSSVLLFAAPINPRILAKLKSNSLVLPRKTGFEVIKEEVLENSSKIKPAVTPIKVSKENSIDKGSF